MENPKNLVALTNIAWKLIKANGFNPRELFEMAGIDPKLLDKPQRRVDCVKINRLWELTSQVIPYPCFAVKACEHWHPSYLGPLGYAWLVTRTLDECLTKFTKYSRIISDSILSFLVQTDTETTIHIEYDASDRLPPVRRVVNLSVFMEMCRLNFGVDLNPLRVLMVNSEPGCLQVYEAYFKSDVVFGAKYDGIVFSKKDTQRPLPIANTYLAQLHDQIIKSTLAELDDSNIVQRVRSLVIDILPSGRITDDIVAGQLNMSPRTFQRKLSKEGTTFRTILNDCRKTVAGEYMKDKRIRLEEIAFLTGFSEYSAFSKAFKRWTGKSPHQWRSNL